MVTPVNERVKDTQVHRRASPLEEKNMFEDATQVVAKTINLRLAMVIVQ